MIFVDRIIIIGVVVVVDQAQLEPRAEGHVGAERGGEVDCGEEAEAEGVALGGGGGGGAHGSVCPL